MSKLDIFVIKDTREQKGWDFHPEEKKPGKLCILGTEIATLDAGDYTIKGYEDIIRIERKMGFAELFGNMTPLDHKERFEREMEKLRDIKHKYILVETSINNDMLGMAPPQFRGGIPSSAVMKWLLKLEMEYNIRTLFVGDAGKRVSKLIFEQIVSKYG